MHNANDYGIKERLIPFQQ